MQHRIRRIAFVVFWVALFARAGPGGAPDGRTLATVLLGRDLKEDERQNPHALWAAVEAHDEVLADWLRQDLAPLTGPELGGSADGLTRFLSAVATVSGMPAEEVGAGSREAALVAYRAACAQRRARRLARVKAEFPRLVYARHFVMGGSHYAYTEALSDAQSERSFRAGGQLCLAEWRDGGLWHETVLTETKEGVIRDADVDDDGRAILFALKRSDRDDDYHLYEMDAATRNIRPLTEGLGIADYEGCYLPDGRILFNSTRCMQIVDCWWTEVSNLYRCDRDGRNILRMTSIRFTSTYPSGQRRHGRVLYTRWVQTTARRCIPAALSDVATDAYRSDARSTVRTRVPDTIIHARGIRGSGKIFTTSPPFTTRVSRARLILIRTRHADVQEAEGVRSSRGGALRNR